MAYIDREIAIKTAVENYKCNNHIDAVNLVEEMESIPTADVVSIETVKAWLTALAKLNKNNVLDDGFSSACEELASNIDELRKFASSGAERLWVNGKHKQNT
jgi:hypothetical protein